MSLNFYSYLIDFKNYLYDRQILKSIKFDVPIISVGNLNTGGSGKTPFIQFLARELKAKKILIISKSYKASLREPMQVDLKQSNAAAIFGDEPVLLQTTLPEVDVWAGPHKFETAQAATLKKKYDVIFIDDGFSHRRLQPTLNIVLVDVSRGLDHYRLLPMGRMREDWKSLKRADVVVLTKTHLVSGVVIDFFKAKIKPFHSVVLQADYSCKLSEPRREIYLFAGVGNPQGLVQDLAIEGYKIIEKRIFADHHKYTAADEKQILADLLKYPELQAVTTEKDFVKLQDQDLKARVICVQLEVKMSSENSQRLNENIRKIF